MQANELRDLVNQKLQNLRPKLLDLSRRNPLLATKLSPRSNAHIRAVDELPDVLYFRLNNGQGMRLVPLPEIDTDPKDEDTKAFRDALANARLTDENYLAQLEAVDRDADDYADRARKIERTLKDRLRLELGLPERTPQAEVNLAQHARIHGVTPSYDLPDPDIEAEDGRYTDDDIQTLLLPKDLERKLTNVTSKCRTWIQETGINVLHVAYGFLEWSEPNRTDTSFAPLVLCSAQIDKKRTREGVEFHITGSGDEPEVNAVLAEKLRLEFGIELPSFDGTSVENYFAAIREIKPKQIFWRVRRQVAIGVFPSARMAMYHDLDPAQAVFPDSEIVRALLAGSNAGTASPFAEEYNVDEPEIEAAVPCVVLDADSSQVSTLVDIAKGKNLAVEGPPGTGKSQTIVNAIAAAIAGGKKVLFVAEKLAALNVVRARLEAVGLGEFLLPLQAERSTREQVIGSVRSRVEMRRPESVRNYESQLAEYRRIRAQIAEYIELLTLSFGNSGFTVHEILGKSIATSPCLERLPSEVLSQVDIPTTLLSAAGIAHLQSLAEAAEKAARGAAEAAPSWKTTKLVQVDRFTAEAACDLALSASQVYRALATLRNDLHAYNIEHSSEAETLTALQKSLEGVLALGGAPDERLKADLLEEGIAAKLASFLDRCEFCVAAERELAEVLATEPDENTLDIVHRVAALCHDKSLGTLDWAVLCSRVETGLARLREAERVAGAMKALAQLRPEAAQWKFADIDRAHRAVAEAGREALLRRNAAMSDPAAPAALATICAEGRALQKMKADLQHLVSLSVEVPVEVLAQAIATLRAGGFLSFVSSSFRRATRLARSLVLAKRFEKHEALQHLEALVSFRRREREFMHSVQTKTLLGLHFLGVETNLAPFERLIAFYGTAQSELSRPEARSLRQFLQLADLDDLDLIPSLPETPVGDTLDDLEIGLVALRRILNDTNRVLEELRPLLGTFRDPAKVQPADLTSLSDCLRALLEERRALSGESELASLLGERFRGPSTASTELRPLCTWAEQAGPVARQVASVLESGRPAEAAAHISRLLETLHRAKSLLSELCHIARIEPAHFTEGRLDEEVGDFLEQAAADREGLFSHAALAATLAELEGTGSDALVVYRLKGGTLDGLAEQVEALAARKLAKAIYAEHGRKLSGYSGTRLDELRSTLAHQDKEIIKLARKQLRWKVQATANPPQGNGMGRKSTYTQMSLIENEIGKQQRFTSVRDLTQRAGRALLELKPCWMMSPLAVAQYVPKNAITFDLCIIDEASQMPPEAAIGALLRSKQVMVVGDTNQLPPSSFFKKMIDDEEADEDDNVLNESILEMANSTFRPARRLRWHYRSRHSALIKFSNRLVYDDNLIVFPSATESLARMGVEFRAIDGLYKAGTNAVEARAIVDAALEFMRIDSSRSLGIVTLNQKQRDLISEEFEHALGRNSHALAYVEAWKEKNDGLEEFFIKNLENVQGDERDVIFIGTVYGPESKGARIAQRFGPINGLAGKRRLNVLFSRAKEKIVTFSSMTSADILADETGNVGSNMLKRWLEYCATGMLDGGKQTHREPDSEFEVFVINQIRAMGYEPVPQVGAAGYFVDIGVRHPDWAHGFVLGVECDGASYHSAKSARDRDRLRQEVLEGLGWRFHRIWSTDWFNNPQREAERLRRVLFERMTELKARQSDFAVTQSVRAEAIAVKVKPESAQASSLLERLGRPIVALTPAKPAESRGVVIGDTVRVRYLGDDRKLLQVTISRAKSDPANGIIHYDAPIAKALLGAEEGDEVEVLSGRYVRSALVESIMKPMPGAKQAPGSLTSALWNDVSETVGGG